MKQYKFTPPEGIEIIRYHPFYRFVLRWMRANRVSGKSFQKFMTNLLQYDVAASEPPKRRKTHRDK